MCHLNEWTREIKFNQMQVLLRGVKYLFKSASELLDAKVAECSVLYVLIFNDITLFEYA